MDNDSFAHRAVIGLFYCNINGICLKNLLLSPFVSVMFSVTWRFFRARCL